MFALLSQNKYYFDLTDPYISYLREPAAFSSLEGLLERYSTQYTELHSLLQDGRLTLGSRVTGRDVKALLPEVVHEVGHLLDVKTARMPSVRVAPLGLDQIEFLSDPLLSWGLGAAALIAAPASLFGGGALLAGALVMNQVRGFLNPFRGREGFFSWTKNEVTMGRLGRAVFVPYLAHEWAHVIQKQEGMSYKNGVDGALIEGHARYVQREVGRTFAFLENNPAFKYRTLQDLTRELSSVYAAISKLEGRKPDPDLMPLSIEAVRPCHYCVGSSLLGVAEALYGPQVYRHVLRGGLDSFLGIRRSRSVIENMSPVVGAARLSKYLLR